MQEEADAVGDTEIAQFGRQRNEMIVVDPDHIIRLDHRQKMICKQAIDPEISGHVLARVIDQIQTIVTKRPEHAVGEACIIFINILLVEIEQRVANGSHIADRQFLHLAIGKGLAGPPEPYASAFAERGLQCHRQPTRRALPCSSGKGTRLETTISRPIYQILSLFCLFIATKAG